MSEATEVEVYEAEVVEIIGDAQILGPADLDRAVVTAKEYPRSIEASQKKLHALATMTKGSMAKGKETGAGSMFFRLPRSGKTIEGPSIRFAECIMQFADLRHTKRRTPAAMQYQDQRHGRAPAVVRRRHEQVGTSDPTDAERAALVRSRHFRVGPTEQAANTTQKTGHLLGFFSGRARQYRDLGQEPATRRLG